MVNNYLYVNIREILSRLLKHPLLQDLSIEDAIHYTIEFIGIMGLPATYVDKIESIEIADYRGVMPCDLISINQVKYRGVCIRSMTDNFSTRGGEPTFKTLGRILYTNFKEGNVEISYKAIPMDEEGFPLLPDNPIFLKTLELYIKNEWFTIKFDEGKISPAVLLNTLQQYAFRAGQCNNEFLIPSVSEMESIKNMMNQLIPRMNEFSTGFKYLGSKEQLKNY